MTFETRCFIDFSDILNLQYTCQIKGCPGGQAIQPISDNGPVYTCPVCKTQWLQPTDTRIQTLQKLSDLLKELKKPHNAFTLKLEIAQTKTS